jgi:hypothetical protein
LKHGAWPRDIARKQGAPILAALKRLRSGGNAMCTMGELAARRDQAAPFTLRMFEILNHGALALMISIGHRTGLFDVMAGLPPSTSDVIAKAAGLNERYVREWLGAMVTGGIVDYSASRGSYRLPPAHAAALTRAAAPNNLAAFAQYIPMLAAVEDRIVDCFEQGGGVPAEAFPRFQAIMAEDSGQTVLPALLSEILPLVPGMTRRLEQGIEVLDVGCGAGLALMLLARTYPESRFTGYDVDPEAIARARVGAVELGLANVTFEQVDAVDMAEFGRFDLALSFDAIHDLARPDLVLRAIRRALRPDGVFLMQDLAGSCQVHKNLDHPIGPFVYTLSCLHCMTVSLAEGGMGLGAMWGEDQARRMLAEAGFGAVAVHRLGHDFQNAYFVCRRG